MATEHNPSPALALTLIKSEPRVDSRVLADSLATQHKSTFALIKSYEADLSAFGKVLFQTEPLPSGQHERFALLNEDQSFLLLTYSRNTATVRELKAKLIRAFSEVRKAAQLRQCEYLPIYHELHDRLHFLAADSRNERFVHSNVNRLVNDVAGIEAGKRAQAPLAQQSLLIVAQAVAARALSGAPDHHVGYQRIKEALAPLKSIGLTEGTHGERP